MSFFCTYCNVDFKRKHHFNAHLLTKKHLKNKNSFNEKNTQQEVLKKTQKKVNLTPENSENSTTYAPHMHHICTTYFKCEFCSQSYKSQRAKSRHTKVCLKKKLLESQKEIEILKSELNETKNEIYRTKKENEELKNNNREMQKSSQDITKLALTNAKTINNNSSINIIINQYKDAPNLTLPENLDIDDELGKYVELGAHHGILSFINKHYGDNLEDKLRSLWCVDASRRKFLIKYDDEWTVDLEAKRFRELTFDTLQKIFYERQKHLMDEDILDDNGKVNDYNLLSNAKFLSGFIDKKNQMKIVNDLSKKLHFKKKVSENDGIELLENENNGVDNINNMIE